MAAPWSHYTPEIGKAICEQMHAGKTLRQIAAMDGMPARMTIWKWRQEHPDFEGMYTLARQMQHDYWADEILSVADERHLDTRIDDEGNVVVIGEVVNRSRLRIDARKWLLSKLRPELYGDTVKLQGDPNAPLGMVIRWDEGARGNGHESQP